MKTIYIGMGLTQAPEAFREDFQQALKTKLRALPNVTIHDFVGLIDGTNRDVYEHDRNGVEESDLFVAICDYPSLGLGMEIAIRQALGKPMIIMAKEGVTITRMLLGMCEKENVPFARYNTTDDIVEAVKGLL